MAIEAGRVGVRADQVDPYGRIKDGGGGTDPAVEKLEEQVGSYSFRTNPEDGSAQYRQSDDGDWVNFSSGGGGAPVLLWENSSPTYYNGGNIDIPNIEDYDFLLFELLPAGESWAREFFYKGYTLFPTIHNQVVNVRLNGGMYKKDNSAIQVFTLRIGTYTPASHRFSLAGNGLYYEGDSSNRADSVNTVAIPYKVYGINLTL